MLLTKIRTICILLCITLCACLALGACAPGTAAEYTPTPPAATPVATPDPTPKPLPEPGALSVQWDQQNGMMLSWEAFSTDYGCTVERKADAASDFEQIAQIDGVSGIYTDTQPGGEGAQPVYRLCVSDGTRTTYSDEAAAWVPFSFGNTGGNLLNGAIACEKDGAVFRMDMQDNVLGIYTWDTEGNSSLLAAGIVSQVNVAGGYLYYLTQGKGQLYRVPLAGGSEPELIFEQKMLFMLVAGERIYGTLEESGALIVMNTDGTELETIVESDCYDLGAYGNVLYYTNTDNAEFCMRNLITGQTTSIPMSDRAFAQLWDGYVYYQNEEDGKKLYRCTPDGSDVTMLLDQAVTGLNVTERGVYCVNSDDGGSLYLVALDGSAAQQLTTEKADFVNVLDSDVLFISMRGRIYLIGEDGSVTKLLG